MSGSSPEGLLVVDKPTGPTSFDVIRRLRGALETRAIGHTGTLDPMASGVLIVCVGWAVKLIRFFRQDQKVYRAEARLGVVTTTDDAEGEVVATHPVNVSAAEVEAALASFTGRIDQRPPVYSALKKQGERAYKRARRGEKVELETRPVRVDAIALESVDLPHVRFEVTCGPGTYIRSLCRDLGEVLGCGGHLTSLRRLANGRFTVDDATPLDALVEAIEAEQPPFVSASEMLSHLPTLDLDPSLRRRLCQGQRLRLASSSAIQPGSFVRICDDEERLLAVAHVEEQFDGASRLKPVKVRPNLTHDQ